MYYFQCQTPLAFLIVCLAILAPILYSKMSLFQRTTPYGKNFHYRFVPGFFKHDQQPTGPGFRAVSTFLVLLVTIIIY